MKRSILAIALMVATTVSVAHAQQPAAPADPHHPQGQAQAPAPPAGSAASPATPGADGMMPMDMCRQMMMGGQMMGGPMMGGHSMMGPGMMGGQQADPKIMAEMMAMRGEMMKAMGDIMLKHAKQLQGMQPSTK